MSKAVDWAQAIALLKECRSDLESAGHQSPRCEHFGKCVCGLDHLLARLDEFLKEVGG